MNMNKFKFGSENADGSDEKFFGGLKKRNLTDLFEDDKLNDIHATLKYQPVKQNSSNNDNKNATPIEKKQQSQMLQKSSKSENTANAMTKWTCIMARAVECHRNGEFQKKVGAAIIQNEEGTFKFIIYRSRSELLGSMDLKTIQIRKVNNYLQFFDENGAYWSVRFFLESEEVEFIDKLKDYGVHIKYEHHPFGGGPKNRVGVGAEQPQGQQQQELSKQRHEQQRQQETNDETSLTATSEDENKSKHSRSSLLTRVAKVGRVLPKLYPNVTISASVDSSNDEKESEELKFETIPSTKSLTHTKTTMTSSICSCAPQENQMVKFLVTESRNQNSDLRFKLRKLENKVEKILDKVEILNISSATSKTRERDDEIIELEEKILTLKKENRKLKQIINDNNEVIHGNCVDGIYKNFEDVFESLGIHRTFDLNTLIELLVEKIQSVDERGQLNANADESYKLLEECKKKLEIERENYMNCKGKMEQLEESTKQLEKTVEAVKEVNHYLEDELMEKTLEVDKSHETTVEAVKDIMNKLFTELTTKIEIEDLRKETVLAVIARTIRDETVNAIEKLELDHSLTKARITN